ncbi:hypothetical protein CcaCcLH18_01838 [Colletotrichum camelliae]|nr:hypothetical protein CcaCcLH18_01838 [Colletotrichum camelliae]
MSPDRHAYFEDDDEGNSTRYSDSWSSRSAQDVESDWPKKGKTRIPSRLVSKRALIDLSYPYITEGNTVIVLKALGQKNIDELLRLSEEYQRYEYVFDGRDDVTDAAGTNRKPEGVSRPGSPIMSNSRSSSPRRRSPFPWQQSSDPNPPAQTVQPPATNAYTKFQDASFNDAPPEERGFVTGTFQLNARERSPIFNQTYSGSSEGQRAWNSPKSFMCDGSISTELFGIHAAEYYMDHSGGHKVTLYCPNRPQGLDSKAPQVRMRWLHLQGVPSELSILEDLVTDCPFVSQDLKSVALKVLMEVSQRCEKASEAGPEIETGAVIRFVGRYTSYRSRRVSAWDTEPVTFLSSPFLHLPEQISKNPVAHTKTLREYLYDYDAGSILQEQMGAYNVTVGEEATSRTFHVPNTWSLIVGSSLFVTFSPLSSAEVLGENIVFDQKALSSSHGIYTVRVIDERNQCRYHIVVDQDYNYVDFLRHAVDLTHSEGVDATTCILADEAGELIDSASWLSLLASGDIENHIFRLRQRDANPTRDEEQKLRSFAMKLLTDGSSVSEDVERVLAESGPYSRQQLLLEYKPREINNQMVVYRPEIWPVWSEVGEASKPARHHISSERIENRQSESTEHPLEERLGGRLLIEDKPRISKTSLEAPQMLRPVFDGLETIFEESSSLEAYMTENPQTPSSEKRIPTVKASDSLPTLLPWTKDTPAAGTQSGFDYPTPEENSLFASAAMSSVSLPKHSPFLTWKMDWNEQTRTKIEKDQALVQLLNGIHESIIVSPRALELIRGWGVKAEQDIHDLLQQAKRDIILMGSTYHDIDRLIIAPIGPEFLLASLVRNTQNDAILQGMKRKIDVVKYYRNFTNKTRFGAVRDPKRQRFLEISALEEELEALRMIIHVQKGVLDVWEQILRPEEFHPATTEWTYIKDREAMYPLESKLIWSQQKKLSDDDKALEGLQNISNALRLNLKQSLEILEEGHGKAIRVFTIVTLFFLPLSFVTSFFGMNTTDVRDTDWDQRIFWSCALPVTFGVLTLAFVYSYKWDMIMEMSFRRLSSTTRTKSPCHILEDDMIPLTGNRNLKKPKQSQVHEEQSSKTRAKVFVSKLRRRLSTKPGTVQRRQTGESLLY